MAGTHAHPWLGYATVKEDNNELDSWFFNGTKKLNMGRYNDARISATVDKTRDAFRQVSIVSAVNKRRRQYDLPSYFTIDKVVPTE